MAESLWTIARDVWPFSLLSRSWVTGWRRGGRVCATALSPIHMLTVSMALYLQTWLGWTESALDVTAASLWLAFANPTEFMKCAEDVTLAPFSFYKWALTQAHKLSQALVMPSNMLTMRKTVCERASAGDTAVARKIFTAMLKHRLNGVHFEFSYSHSWSQ